MSKLLFSGAISQFENAFFISPEGSDLSGDGSFSNPWETFEKVRDEMAASSTVKTVYLLDGTYSRAGPCVLSANDSGQTWIAYPGATPIINGNGDKINFFNLSSADNVTWQGLTFYNTTGTDQNSHDGDVFFIDSSDDGLILECTFDTVHGCWARPSGAEVTGWKVLESTFTDIATRGFSTVGGWSHFTFCGNSLTRVCKSFAGLQSLGFIQSNGMQNFTIQFNTVDTCAYAFVLAATTNRAAINNIITDNVIVNNGFYETQDNECGALYTMGRVTNSNSGTTWARNWIETSGTSTNDKAKGYYIDDSGGDILMEDSVLIDCWQGLVQVHGGNNNTLTNSILLMVEGQDRSWNNVINDPADQFGCFYQSDSTYGGTGAGNLFENLIVLSVDYPDFDFVNRNSSTGAHDWLHKQGTIIDPTVENNVLWPSDVPFAFSENSNGSVHQNPDFHTYDPANKVLRLNKISRGDGSDSPAYGLGFTDIAGVTDGGTFAWGSPLVNPNSGYNRSDYI